jgi:copper chaperone CopZ
MDRRNFLYRVMAGVAGTTTAFAVTEATCSTGSRAAGETQCVAYEVKGFSCVACAVGLETMLLQHKGVTRVKASYPEARIVIGFDRNLTSEENLREFIAACGFSVI